MNKPHIESGQLGGIPDLLISKPKYYLIDCKGQIKYQKNALHKVINLTTHGDNRLVLTWKIITAHRDINAIGASAKFGRRISERWMCALKQSTYTRTHNGQKAAAARHVRLSHFDRPSSI
jgi:hypothetical protein